MQACRLWKAKCYLHGKGQLAEGVASLIILEELLPEVEAQNRCAVLSSPALQRDYLFLRCEVPSLDLLAKKSPMKCMMHLQSISMV